MTGRLFQRPAPIASRRPPPEPPSREPCGAQSLIASAMPPHQTAAADRHDPLSTSSVSRISSTDVPLPGDDERVLKRVHERAPRSPRAPSGALWNARQDARRRGSPPRRLAASARIFDSDAPLRHPDRALTPKHLRRRARRMRVVAPPRTRHTPARLSAAVSRDIRVSAPRSLNEPVCCKLSVSKHLAPRRRQRPRRHQFRPPVEPLSRSRASCTIPNVTPSSATSRPSSKLYIMIPAATAASATRRARATGLSEKIRLSPHLVDTPRASLPIRARILLLGSGIRRKVIRRAPTRSPVSPRPLLP
jgi:hypothetical protein